MSPVGTVIEAPREIPPKFRLGDRTKDLLAPDFGVNATLISSEVNQLQILESFEKVWMDRVDFVVVAKINVEQVRFVFEEPIGKCLEFVSAQSDPLQFNQILEGFGFNGLDFIIIKIQAFYFLEFLFKEA
jgi:hypothetical protein